ncbi:MAG: hypothetical protein AMXMBFR84_12940 [Candidatus Hydrogenedentota bacterium]
MRSLTVAQMREADRRCIEVLGIPGAVLMNNAGMAVFSQIPCGPVGVVCGKGNNGGDGFVVARLALQAKMDVKVILLCDPSDVSGDAATFLKSYQKLGGYVALASTGIEAERALKSLDRCCTLVDAMLGTGFTGAPREPYRFAIAQWPDMYTIAVDVPSGLNADTGRAEDVCIHAHVTVSLQCQKVGFTNPEAIPYLGKVVIADIGIPEVCWDDKAWRELIVHELA